MVTDGAGKSAKLRVRTSANTDLGREFLLGGLSASHSSCAVSKPYPRRAFALAITAQDHVVAVFEKLPGFAIRQLQWFGATPRQFQQASQRVRTRA